MPKENLSEKVLEQLQNYFDNTPKEEIDKAVAAINAMGTDYGVDVDEYFASRHKDTDTFRNIEKESEPYIGTLVLESFEVVLFKGVEADLHDYYYVYQPAKGGGCNADGKEYWSSCVGKHNILKGVLPDREYDRLVWLWNNNFNEGIAK
jgi:hypothetical protein